MKPSDYDQLKRVTESVESMQVAPAKVTPEEIGQEVPRLCFVNYWSAYFTTQDVTKQWGDDWNDAPYEHNAGSPYTWHEGRSGPKWEIVKVAYEGPFEHPSDGFFNSPYSVRQINAGAIAWLRTSRRYEDSIAIPAGTSLSDFVRLVKQVGGEVYLPAS